VADRGVGGGFEMMLAVSSVLTATASEDFGRARVP